MADRPFPQLSNWVEWYNRRRGQSVAGAVADGPIAAPLSSVVAIAEELFRRSHCRRKRTENFVECNLYIVLKKQGSQAQHRRIPGLVSDTHLDTKGCLADGGDDGTRPRCPEWVRSPRDERCERDEQGAAYVPPIRLCRH